MLQWYTNSDIRILASLECSNVVFRHVKPRIVGEARDPRFTAYDRDFAKAIVRSLINNVFGFLVYKENSLIGFTEVIPGNRIKIGYQEPFEKKKKEKQVLPSSELHEGQLISQGNKLLPTNIKKPITTTFKPVLGREMCAI